MYVLAALLFVSAALAVWIAAAVSRRPGVGTREFVWLSAAIALWCATSGAHALAGSVEAKLRWAQLQYVGIAPLAPLWLAFAAAYAGVNWLSSWRVRAVLVALPVSTIAVAVTNQWHHALWTGLEIQDNGLAVYSHGPWFWSYAAFSHALIAAGTILIVRRLRRSPPAMRAQSAALLAAALCPWAGNVLYLTVTAGRGLDLTPVAFAGSSVFFAVALYRAQLFDLVPVARDVVIDSLSDGMLVLDPSRRILDLNAAAHELIRRHGAGTVDRALGQPVDTLLPMLARTPLVGTAATPEVIAPSPLEPTCFEVRLLPVRWRGESPGACWVVLLRDVTARRAAEAERHALQERMQEQQRRESLSILAAGLAHDFNNLLTGIVGNADLLALQVPASSSMGHHVGAILLGAQRAADLVSKMLAYAGERHGSASRVDIDGVTRDLLDLLRASAARHCTVVYDGTPAVVDADPTQVRQVAMNLIINAAEAVSDAGTVTVSVGSQTLTAADLSRMRFGQDAPPGSYAFLDVRDDGVGIDEATLRRLFQPFFTTKVSGHGLGLAAVQGIVMGHRGALTVESRPGQGARFCVWFPLAARDGEAVDHRASELTAPGPPGAGYGSRVAV